MSDSNYVIPKGLKIELERVFTIMTSVTGQKKWNQLETLSEIKRLESVYFIKGGFKQPEIMMKIKIEGFVHSFSRYFRGFAYVSPTLRIPYALLSRSKGNGLGRRRVDIWQASGGKYLQMVRKWPGSDMEVVIAVLKPGSMRRIQRNHIILYP